MIDPQIWVTDVLAKPKDAVGSCLAYLGLQGSYGRGEAADVVGGILKSFVAQ